MSLHDKEQLARGLVHKLRGGDAALRAQAAIRLSEMSGEARLVLGELLAALGDRDPHVRRVTAWVLGHVSGDHPDVVRALDRAALDSDASVRRVARASQALGDLHRAA